jgi:hypothetical protein
MSNFSDVNFISDIYKTIFEKLQNIEKLLLSIADLNIFIFENNLDEASDYWQDYLYNQG